MLVSEIETVLILTKRDRIDQTYFTLWTNDSVVETMMKDYGIEPVRANNYILTFDKFLFLPKRKIKKAKAITYIKYPVLPNDPTDKETLVSFSRNERKANIMCIKTDDEYFIHMFKNRNVEYDENMHSFISRGQFKAFGKKTVRMVTDEQKKIASERLKSYHENK